MPSEPKTSCNSRARGGRKRAACRLLASACRSERASENAAIGRKPSRALFAWPQAIAAIDAAARRDSRCRLACTARCASPPRAVASAIATHHFRLLVRVCVENAIVALLQLAFLGQKASLARAQTNERIVCELCEHKLVLDYATNVC